MNLNIDQWQEFAISDILIVLNGKGITQDEIMEFPGTFTVVQSGEENNGVLGYIDLDYCVKRGYTYTQEKCLTVARSGSAGFVSYHPQGCVVGDSAKILMFKNKEIATEYAYLFIRTILMANKYKYSYGRKVTEDKYLSEILLLPVTETGQPDWEFMEKYIMSLHYKPLTTRNRPKLEIETKTWKEYLLNDYFDIQPGKYHYPDEYDVGMTPYYSASNVNNGIAQYIDLEPEFKGNSIVTGKIGCTAFYAPDDFCATSDVNVFSPLFAMSEYVALFIVTVINYSENYKWAYGRQCRAGNSKRIKIRLPASSDGKPDWDYMESYIKQLRYGDRLTLL